jgi:outer membrane protein assembly factor BamB
MKAIAITVLGMICFMASAQETVTTKWRGPTGDGIYHETGLLDKWPKSGPTMIWHFDELGLGYSSPSFANGRIYITGMVDHTGYVFVLSESGELIDRFEYGEEFYTSYPGSRSTVTVAGDLMYVISARGGLVCMNSGNGEIRWGIDLFKDFDGKNLQWGMNESPLVDGNILYCTPGGSRRNMVALNRFTGKLIWESRGKGNLSAYCTPLLVELSSRKILVTHTEKNIICLDAKDGELLWSHYHANTYAIHPNTPIYNDGSVYCFSGSGQGGVMIELNEFGNMKRVKWIDKTLDSKMGGAVLLDGYIYGSGELNRSWKSLNWETGAQGYSSSLVGPGVTISSDGKLYLYSQRGELVMVPANPTEFTITGNTRVTMGSGQHWAHPVINNGRLFVRHGNVLMAYAIR